MQIACFAPLAEADASSSQLHIGETAWGLEELHRHSVRTTGAVVVWHCNAEGNGRLAWGTEYQSLPDQRRLPSYQKKSYLVKEMASPCRQVT